MLTTSQAARLLRISSSTLKRRAAAGTIPAERTAGGHLRFRRSDLDEVLASGGSRADDPTRWADVLLGAEEPLRLYGRLFEARSRLGSWWTAAERLTRVVAEMRRRRESGELTALHLRYGIERLARAVACALAHAPRPAGAPTALLAGVAGDGQDVALPLLELCLPEVGWSGRWVGAAAPDEVADEVRRSRPDALIVCALATPDRRAAVPLAPELSALARDEAVPIALVGFDDSSGPHGDADRLQSLAEVRAWIHHRVGPTRARANGNGPVGGAPVR